MPRYYLVTATNEVFTTDDLEVAALFARDGDSVVLDLQANTATFDSEPLPIRPVEEAGE